MAKGLDRQFQLLREPENQQSDPGTVAVATETYVAPVFVEGTDEWALDVARWCRRVLKTVKGDCSKVTRNLPALRKWCECHSTEWDQFCRDRLEIDPGFLAEIERGVQILRGSGDTKPVTQARALKTAQAAQAADAAPPLPTHTESAKKQPRTESGKMMPKTSKETVSSNSTNGSRGNDYLSRRIKRDAPEVFERMKAGEFRSVAAAAREAGIKKAPDMLGIALKSVAKLTYSQRRQLWVELGGIYANEVRIETL